MKAYWKDDKPMGQVIFDRFARFIAIADFKDGQPSGEFSYYFPISFIKINGKASIVGENKLYVEGQIIFPTMNFQVSGFVYIKEEKVEFEYKANCLGKIIEMKKNFIFG